MTVRLFDDFYWYEKLEMTQCDALSTLLFQCGSCDFQFNDETYTVTVTWLVTIRIQFIQYSLDLRRRMFRKKAT